MTKKNDKDELKKLVKILDKRGFSVRRENLTQGHSFKTRSGGCELLGNNLIFIDKRLSHEQQMSTLIDCLLELGFFLDPEDLENLHPSVRPMLMQKAA